MYTSTKPHARSSSTHAAHEHTQPWTRKPRTRKQSSGHTHKSWTHTRKSWTPTPQIIDAHAPIMDAHGTIMGTHKLRIHAKWWLMDTPIKDARTYLKKYTTHGHTYTSWTHIHAIDTQIHHGRTHRTHHGRTYTNTSCGKYRIRIGHRRSRLVPHPCPNLKQQPRLPSLSTTRQRTI